MVNPTDTLSQLRAPSLTRLEMVFISLDWATLMESLLHKWRGASGWPPTTALAIPVQQQYMPYVWEGMDSVEELHILALAPTIAPDVTQGLASRLAMDRLFMPALQRLHTSTTSAEFPTGAGALQFPGRPQTVLIRCMDSNIFPWYPWSKPVVEIESDDADEASEADEAEEG